MGIAALKRAASKVTAMAKGAGSKISTIKTAVRAPAMLRKVAASPRLAKAVSTISSKTPIGKIKSVATRMASRATSSSKLKGATAKAMSLGGKVLGTAKTARDVAAFTPTPVGAVARVSQIAETAGGIAVGTIKGAGRKTGKQITASSFGKRRKGKVPKTVRKWVTKVTSRRKQESKLLRKLIHVGYSKPMTIKRRAK